MQNRLVVMILDKKRSVDLTIFFKKKNVDGIQMMIEFENSCGRRIMVFNSLMNI